MLVLFLFSLSNPQFLIYLLQCSRFTVLCQFQVAAQWFSYPSIFLFVCVSIFLSFCLNFYFSICLSIFLSICIFIYISVYLYFYCISICLSIHLSTHLSFFIFVPLAS